MELPVLTEQNVWPEFREPIDRLGPAWDASSGRHYLLHFDGEVLDVILELEDLEKPPPDEEIDRDLLELSGQIYDAVGGEWSSEALRNVASMWGWDVSGK